MKYTNLSIIFDIKSTFGSYSNHIKIVASLLTIRIDKEKTKC